jgi:transposase
VAVYPSDMTDEQWAVVRDALPVPAWLEGRGGQPEGYCHRQMLDAIFCVTDNGIKWRAMPADFPAWVRVYAFLSRWRGQGLVKELHDRLRGQVRQAEGRAVEPTAAIIDSQSVKGAASVPAATRGYDGGRKINGRCRHVITDCLGLLLVVLVTAGDVTDRQAAASCCPNCGPASGRSPWYGPTADTPAASSPGRGRNSTSPLRSSMQRRHERVRSAAEALGGGRCTAGTG